MRRYNEWSWEETLRAMINPFATVPWRSFLNQVFSRTLEAVLFAVFVCTTVPKTALFLYAGYPSLYALSLCYSLAKTCDFLFGMPWWFQCIDFIGSIATLPSKILETF